MARTKGAPVAEHSTLAKLSEEAQIYVVTALATWTPEAEILKTLAERFPGEVCSPQNLWHYNPRNIKCPQRWRDLHAETRRAFVASKAEIAIANPVWRLTERERLYRLVVDKPQVNVPLAAEILDGAAKDAGDGFSAKRELTGPGGKPLFDGISMISAADLLREVRAGSAEQVDPIEPEALDPAE